MPWLRILAPLSMTDSAGLTTEDMAQGKTVVTTNTSEMHNIMGVNLGKNR